MVWQPFSHHRYWPKAAIALGQRLNSLETAKSVVRKPFGRLSQVDPVALTVEYLSHAPKVAFDFVGELQALTRKPFELNLELGDDDRYDPVAGAFVILLDLQAGPAHVTPLSHARYRFAICGASHELLIPDECLVKVGNGGGGEDALDSY
ncbi:hypothetical protein [Rhizobium aethiopicum]|nr:hypothetical protein [Rhizobium aethiopicum]